MDPTTPPIDSDLVYVGFWMRVFASLVDSILLMLLMVPVGYVLFGSLEWGLSRGISDTSDFIVSIVLPAAVIVLFWSQVQSTPGKMMFGARIVDAKTGAEPTTGQWALRYFGYYVSAVVVLLGFVWIAFDARKQGLHDKIAGTVVVRRRDSGADPLGINR